MSIFERVWGWWKWLLRRVGNFQAVVLLSLVYVPILPLIAIPHKILADPLNIKGRRPAFVDFPEVSLTSIEAARKQ